MTKLTGGRKLNREIADITPLEDWANTTDTKLIKEYREAPDNMSGTTLTALTNCGYLIWWNEVNGRNAEKN